MATKKREKLVHSVSPMAAQKIVLLGLVALKIPRVHGATPRYGSLMPPGQFEPARVLLPQGAADRPFVDDHRWP
jgi:hypothetical protein